MLFLPCTLLPLARMPPFVPPKSFTVKFSSELSPHLQAFPVLFLQALLQKYLQYFSSGALHSLL